MHYTETYLWKQINALATDWQTMSQAIAAVRELHVKQSRDGVDFCGTCAEPHEDEWQAWPCETMKAIEQ